MFLPQGCYNLRNNVLAVFSSNELLAQNYRCDYVFFHRATGQGFFLTRENLNCTCVPRMN